MRDEKWKTMDLDSAVHDAIIVDPLAHLLDSISPCDERH